MDIDISQLPPDAMDALERRHEQFRVMRDGKAVATVISAERPVFASHKQLRERVGRLEPAFATLLREERDER